MKVSRIKKAHRCNWQAFRYKSHKWFFGLLLPLTFFPLFSFSFCSSSFSSSFYTFSLRIYVSRSLYLSISLSFPISLSISLFSSFFFLLSFFLCSEKSEHESKQKPHRLVKRERTSVFFWERGLGRVLNGRIRASIDIRYFFFYDINEEDQYVAMASAKADWPRWV